MVAVEKYAKYLGLDVKFARQKKPKTVLKDILTEAEMILVLYACKNLKEKAIIALLAYSGIRCQELCNLRVEDINFGSNQIRVIQGKGNKSRLACVASDCMKIIMDYLSKNVRPVQEFLFTTNRAKTQMTTWGIRKTVRTIGRRVLPARRIYPHLFRHSLATAMLNRGASLMTIKEQLGHVFIQTTMIYARSSFARVEAEYQLYAPRLV
jgi:integrase/recombinase XerD